MGRVPVTAIPCLFARRKVDCCHHVCIRVDAMDGWVGLELVYGQETDGDHSMSWARRDICLTLSFCCSLCDFFFTKYRFWFFVQKLLPAKQCSASVAPILLIHFRDLQYQLIRIGNLTVNISVFKFLLDDSNLFTALLGHQSNGQNVGFYTIVLLGIYDGRYIEILC